MISRLVCLLFGHRWQRDRYPVRKIHYRDQCVRCGVTRLISNG